MTALVVLLFLAIGVGSFLLTTWALMLVIGGVHHSVWEAVPALGFWPTALVVAALALVGQVLRLGTSSSS